MLENMPALASIRAFEAAARHGSFAKAAAELATTAASVSYHVRQLERQVGMPLFVRHAQKVTLTEQGEAIAPELTALFTSMRATFANAVDAYEARLSLTALPTFGTAWLTPRLGGFRKAHKDIAIALELSETAHEIGAGRYDAAIRNGGGRWTGLRSVKLFPSVFMPLCSPALKSALKYIGDPRRALEAPLLGRPDWWATWYEQRGYRGVDLFKRFGTSLQAEYLDAAAAIAGQGVTIGSPILFADDIKAGRLVPAHDFMADSGRAFWFVYPAVREKSRKIAAFREWIRSEAEQANAEYAAVASI